MHRKTVAKYSLFDKNINLLQIPDGNQLFGNHFSETRNENLPCFG